MYVPLFEDPEGNAYKFYVDHDMDYWVYDNENVKLDIEAINVPRLLTNVSEQTWQGIPKGTKIGNLSLKTIRMSEVESYYLRYFGLELSAYLDRFHSICLQINTIIIWLLINGYQVLNV